MTYRKGREVAEKRMTKFRAKHCGGRAPRDTAEDTVGIMLQLALRLFQGHAISARYIRDHFRVSRATAHRYMLRLEVALPVSVTEQDAGCPLPIHVMRLQGHRQGGGFK